MAHTNDRRGRRRAVGRPRAILGLSFFFLIDFPMVAIGVFLARRFPIIADVHPTITWLALFALYFLLFNHLLGATPGIRLAGAHDTPGRKTSGEEEKPGTGSSTTSSGRRVKGWW